MGRDVGLSLGQHYTQRTDTVTNLIESPNLSGYLEQSKLLTDVSILFLLWDLVNLYDKQIFYPTEKDRERKKNKYLPQLPHSDTKRKSINKKSGPPSAGCHRSREKQNIKEKETKLIETVLEVGFQFMTQIISSQKNGPVKTPIFLFCVCVFSLDKMKNTKTHKKKNVVLLNKTIVFDVVFLSWHVRTRKAVS